MATNVLGYYHETNQSINQIIIIITVVFTLDTGNVFFFLCLLSSSASGQLVSIHPSIHPSHLAGLSHADWWEALAEEEEECAPDVGGCDSMLFLLLTILTITIIILIVSITIHTQDKQNMTSG